MAATASTLATVRSFALLAVMSIAFLGWPDASPGAAPAHAARSCGHVDESNFYRTHIAVRGTSCHKARRLYRALTRFKGTVPGPDPWVYGHAGPPFSLAGWTCRYTPEGLAGSEYTLRCTRGSRVVRLRRRQDG